MTPCARGAAPVRRLAPLFALTIVFAASACGGKPQSQPGVAVDPRAHDAGSQEDDGPQEADDCPEDNPFCDSRDDSDADCGNTPIDVTPAGVNIMVAVDGAASMATHWSKIKDALRNLRKAHPDAAMGVQLFWGELADWTSGWEKNNWCGSTKNKFQDVSNASAEELAGVLGDAPPGGTYGLGGLWETSPVIEPLNYYLEQSTKLADPERTNYLLFITNGNDNCFGSVFAQENDKLLAYQKLAVELGKRNIRIIPIGFDASAAPGSTGALGTVNGNTDLEVLSTLLQYGNSGLKEVPKVDDPAKFSDVLTQVGKSVRNCRFVIPDALEPAKAVNPFQLDFVVNGKVVERDRKNLNGWNFVAGNASQVELFGQACQALQNDAQFEARKTCSSDVCGTASIKVETKPRAVLFVFDVSASRIQCTDGTSSCQVAPQLGMRPSVSYWEAVGHAVNQALVAPINDDIEFGIQFFPAKSSSALSCDVAATPEIPCGDGTEISLMSAILEKLPFGSSPLSHVLQNVAAAPGRLADPEVKGAVVVLSAGGDSCAGVDQSILVQQLGDAAKRLRDANVDTYAVRYGLPSDKTPANEEQLRTIVKNGGTDMSTASDPSKSPYVDAKDDAELNQALAGISDSLSTCSFGVDGFSEDADKANANLYLNGEAIPFDREHAAHEGWDWADATQSAIQLFGEACKAFKNNRRTSVIVELGCEPIVLL
ncbi:MAG: VWA domain-containing protein [Myxococcales bacterium]